MRSLLRFVFWLALVVVVFQALLRLSGLDTTNQDLFKGLKDFLRLIYPF